MNTETMTALQFARMHSCAIASPRRFYGPRFRPEAKRPKRRLLSYAIDSHGRPEWWRFPDDYAARIERYWSIEDVDAMHREISGKVALICTDPVGYGMEIIERNIVLPKLGVKRFSLVQKSWVLMEDEE